MLGVFPGPFGIEGACLRCGAFMRKWSVMSAGNWALSDKLKVAERQGQAAMKSLADKKNIEFLAEGHGLCFSERHGACGDENVRKGIEFEAVGHARGGLGARPLVADGGTY